MDEVDLLRGEGGGEGLEVFGGFGKRGKRSRVVARLRGWG